MPRGIDSERRAARQNPCRSRRRAVRSGGAREPGLGGRPPPLFSVEPGRCEQLGGSARHPELEPARMELMAVERAEQRSVAHVGAATVLPLDHMVSVAPGGWGGAVGADASTV